MRCGRAALVLGWALFFVGGCAEAGRYDPHPWRVSFRDRAGAVTEADLFTRLPRILISYGYGIEDIDQYQKALRLVTQWRSRVPFEDEQVVGIESVRTRLTFRANWDGKFYQLYVEAENESPDRTGHWIATRPTRQANSYLSDVVGDIRMEIATGVRRY